MSQGHAVGTSRTDGNVNDTVTVATRRLSAPALRPLVDALARRMGASKRPIRSVRVTLDEEGRHALADLLAMTRIPPATSSVSAAQLNGALDVDDAGLRSAVEAITGPLGNRSAARQAARSELDAAIDTVAATAEPLGAEVARWAAATVRSLPGPIDERVSDITGVLTVITDSRSHGAPVPVPVAAAEAFADPHALDENRRCGTLLANCAALVAGSDLPTSSRTRRAALAAVGLAADELSSTVASWAVIPQADHPLHAWSQMLHDAGEPAVWTLSMLQRWPLTAAAARILVVENPAVLTVAAQRRLATPVVCSAGMPTVAVATLVDQLADAGSRVEVHADFDTAGLRIVATLTAAGRAQPWQMGAADYRSALACAGHAVDDGAVPPTPWDPELATAFAADRRVVFEEQLLDQILA